jgi:hypothetical protein
MRKKILIGILSFALSFASFCAMPKMAMAQDINDQFNLESADLSCCKNHPVHDKDFIAAKLKIESKEVIKKNSTYLFRAYNKTDIKGESSFNFPLVRYKNRWPSAPSLTGIIVKNE